MEPLFFKAENGTVYLASFRWQLGLQWSRFFSKRKIPDLELILPKTLTASMEPLFFKAENQSSPHRLGTPLHRFNGAAFFQSGKFYGEGISRTDFFRFNGAAFFQSGKSTPF